MSDLKKPSTSDPITESDFYTGSIAPSSGHVAFKFSYQMKKSDIAESVKTLFHILKLVERLYAVTFEILNTVTLLKNTRFIEK